MVLKIVKEFPERVDGIKMVQEADSVAIWINGEVIARAYDKGCFNFYGQSGNLKYRGDWKEKVEEED